MPTLSELLREEKEPSVRVVLRHFIIMCIHSDRLVNPICYSNFDQKPIDYPTSFSWVYSDIKSEVIGKAFKLFFMPMAAMGFCSNLQNAAQLHFFANCPKRGMLSSIMRQHYFLAILDNLLNIDKNINI